VPTRPKKKTGFIANANAMIRPSGLPDLMLSTTNWSEELRKSRAGESTNTVNLLPIVHWDGAA
jgi:hypothetical protein